MLEEQLLDFITSDARSITLTTSPHDDLRAILNTIYIQTGWALLAVPHGAYAKFYK